VLKLESILRVAAWALHVVIEEGATFRSCLGGEVAAGAIPVWGLACGSRIQIPDHGFNKYARSA
jgi:hypothetical protein